MRLIIFILTFFYILGPVPNTKAGLYLDSSVFISLVLIVINAFNSLKLDFTIYKALRNMWILYFLYVVLIGFSFSVMIYKDESLSQEFFRPVRILILFYGALSLFKLYIKNFQDKYDKALLVNIALIISINAVCIIAESFSENFREIINQFVYKNISEIHFQTEKRAGGLMLSGGSVPSAVLGFGLLISVIAYNKKYIKLALLLILIFALFFGMIMTGRTGLLFFIPAFILLIRGRKISLYGIILTMFTLIVLSYFFVFISGSKVVNESENATFNMNRTIATLNHYFNYGGETEFVEGGVEDVLLSKFSIPDDILVVIFGQIGFTNYNFSEVSDSGFNISLYRYGMIGSLIYYMPLFYILFRTIKQKYNKFDFSYFIFILMFFILEMKENAVFSKTVINILLLMFFISQFNYIHYLSGKESNKIIDNN